MAAKKKVSPELQRLRDLARKDRANATQKIYRMRQKNIKISGTEYDPRRDVAVINKYNVSQLRSYIQKLEEFSGRDIQFSAGAGGVPLPRGLVREYERLKRTYNEIVDLRQAERAPYILPGEGNMMTIGEREQYVLPENLRMRNSAATSIFNREEINPVNIAGEFGLKEKIKEIKNKLKPSYFNSAIRDQRKEVTAMLDIIGDKVTIKSIKGLSRHQFDVLFNSTKFVRSVSRIYEFYKRLSSDEKESWYRDKYNDEVSELNEAIEWARSLPNESALQAALYRYFQEPDYSSDTLFKEADIKLNIREYNKGRNTMGAPDKLEAKQEAARQNREYYKNKNK